MNNQFSDAWQLQQGTRYMPQRWRNYEIVQALWQSIDWDNVPPSGKSTRAEHIPTWHDMRQAWTTYWTEDHPMTYIQYSQAINCAWWGYFIGPRSKEDIRRLKISRDIVRRPREGQTSVGFVGGRCKTPVKTAWRGYGVCMCPDGVHIVPEPSDLDNLDENGNPIEPFEWGNCPCSHRDFCALFEKTKGRLFPKVNPDGNGFIDMNEWDPAAKAIDWFVAQGVCEDANRFDHNSGRKALARMCTHCNIPYEESFEVHADNYVTWQRSYEPLCTNPSNFNRRTQHTNPDVACKALRKIARSFGLGEAVETPMNATERFLHALVARMDPKLAEAIKLGLPDPEKNVQQDPSPPPPPPPRTRKLNVPEPPF